MEVKKAIEIIEKFGIDCRGYLSLEKAVDVVLEYTKAQLSQENATSDSISRQAAIEALYSVDEYNPRSIKAIKDLPSVQSKPQWISCNERLPDVAQRVLLSGHGMVMVGMLHSFGKYSLEPTGISYVYPKDDIEAWMPLPEPYDYNYEKAVEQLEHDILYEPTFNQDDGSM